MTTVRNKFHDVGNKLNKIALASMVAQEVLKKVDVAQYDNEELAKAVNKAVESFKKIDKFVAEADNTIGSFKPYVYKTLDPDVDIKEKH